MTELSKSGPSGTAAVEQKAAKSPKFRKWIAEEIEQLDADKDYARIWALSLIYYGDDLLANLIYALGMPCFVQNHHGSVLIMDRTRKGRDRKHDRANDTLAHFWRWFEYGPEHIEAQRSIKSVNRIHTALGKQLPEAFANDDFIYTTSYLAVILDKLRRKIGLNGFTDKQKRAAFLFWRNVAFQMRGPEGHVSDFPFPQSWDEMNLFVRNHEARDWPTTQSGIDLSEYVIQQFNEARFPSFLHGVGRQIVLTFQEPHIRKLHDMGDPNPLVAKLIRFAFKLKVWSDENLFRDPIESTPVRARLAGDTADQHRIPPLVAPSSCPFHSGAAK